MKTISLTVIAFGLVLAISPVRVGAQRAWVEVKSPHFTVVSNDSEGSARAISWQLEQVRGVIERLWTWARVDTAKPIIVIAAKDEASMKALAPQFWEQKDGVRPSSVFAEGADRYAILLRSDLKADDREGINPYITAYWSYVALILSSSLDRDLPLWFQRGLSGVFSNTIVRDSSIQLGRVIPWNLQRLREGTRLSLRELMAVDRQSPWYTKGERLEQFDAQSWAFVHFLMFGERGVHRQQLDRFMAVLHSGKTPAAAQEEALGNLDAVENAFSAYFSRQLYEYLRVDVDTRMTKEGFQVRSVTPAESASLRASVHAVLGRKPEARAALEEARKADAGLAMASDTDGLLNEADRKVDDARVAYAKAVELKSTNFYTYYRLAALTWNQNADAETLTRLGKWLDQSIALNDRFAPAHALLGEVDVRLHRQDEALRAAQRAIALDSGSVQHRLSLARVFWNSARPDEGRTEAQRALAIARTDDDRRSAQTLLEFFERNAARPAAQPGAPASWPPAGAVRDGSGVTLPKVVREVRPNYTQDAINAKLEGVVGLECVVGVDGRVTDVQIIRSLDSKFGLDQEAVKAAREWRFEPGTRMGQAVPVLITIELTFTLKK